MLIEGIIFAITGYYFYNKILLVSFSKAIIMKSRIILSIILISVPIIIRGLYTFITWFYDFHHNFIMDSRSNNDWAYPLYILLYTGLLEMIPMGLQYLSIRMVLDKIPTERSRIVRKI